MIPTRTETETELMKALAGNSVDAFTLIYNMYIRQLRSYVYNMVSDREEVEDILQETFANLWRYHDRIDPGKSLATLLFTIARRQALNSLRNRRMYDFSIDSYCPLTENFMNKANSSARNGMGGGKHLVNNRLYFAHPGIPGI